MTTLKKLIQKKERFKSIQNELTSQFYKFNEAIDDFANLSILLTDIEYNKEQDKLVLRANILQTEISELLKVYKYRIKKWELKKIYVLKNYTKT